MVHSFVWRAVIWFLEMYCGAQAIKTFQLHLGAVSQICSWWKFVRFQRFWWFVCSVELSVRKAGTVNSSFIQYTRYTLFKSLEKVSFLSVRLIRQIGPELFLKCQSEFSPGCLSAWVLLHLHRNQCLPASRDRVLGFPCKGRHSRGTPNSLTPAWAAKLKLFTVSHNISQSLQNSHWSFSSSLYN